jgi:hypothetical protein
MKTLHMASLLKTTAREIVGNDLDLVAVGIRWNRDAATGDYRFLYGNGNENHELGTGIFVLKRIIQAALTVEFVNDRGSDIILRYRWCDVIVLNVHAPIEDRRLLRRTASMRNYNRYSVSSRSTT